MASIKTLASQTAVYGISAILSKFLNFLLTPYFTYVMAPEVFANVTLWYGLIPFVNVLLVMGLSTSYFRWCAKAPDGNARREIFSTFWFAVSMAALSFFALCCIFRVPLTEALGYGASRYIVMVALLILIDNVAAIPLAALRERGRALRYTVVNVSGVLVNILCCVAFYSLIPDARGDAQWVIVANIIASGVQLLMLTVSTRRLVTLKIRWSILKGALVYSLPLMVAGVMGMGSDFIDRQMLRWLLPEDQAMTQVGVYGAVAKLASIMIIFRQIYTLGAEPFFLQNFKKEDFLRMNAAALKYFTLAGILLLLGCSYFLDLLIQLLGRSYREGIDVVPVLLLANLMMGVLVNLSFWYKVAEKTRYAIYVTAIGLVSVVVGCWLLIPNYGYYGAAYAHLISAGVMVVVSYIFNQVHYKVPYERLRIVGYLALGGVLYVAGVWAAQLEALVAYILKFLLLLSFIMFVAKCEKIKINKLWKRK